MDYDDSTGFSIQWFHKGTHVVPADGSRFQIEEAGTTATCFLFEPAYTRDSGEFWLCVSDSVANFIH